MEEEELVKFVLAELVYDMGGVAEMDASVLLDRLNKNELKRLEMTIKGDKLIVEVFDE